MSGKLSIKRAADYCQLTESEFRESLLLGWVDCMLYRDKRGLYYLKKSELDRWKREPTEPAGPQVNVVFNIGITRDDNVT